MKKEGIIAKVKYKPLEIIIGKSYKNFTGYERVIFFSMKILQKLLITILLAIQERVI